MISQYVYISDIERGKNPRGVSFSKNITFFEAESAIFCISKTPLLFNQLIHLKPLFAVLSEEINILLITPQNAVRHYYPNELYH